MTIATICPIGDKFRALILFAGNLEPVEFFMRTVERDDLFATLHLKYVGIDVVTQQRFQMELDHIKLFGCRWDAPSYELPASDRLTDNQINELLTNTERTLDHLEEQTSAIFPIPTLERTP